ncbi:MAG: TldD/PmbA family protein [Candidatus ainarchaeum sp.]|nr:TldD/PmbA family protein [Candidatus ainarchaeum sp.]
MGSDLADFAVKHALRLGATYAEARFEKIRASMFSLKNGVPQLGGFEEASGLGLRLVFHGAMEYCSTDWMDKGHVEKLVEGGMKDAAANARLVKDPVLLSVEEAEKAKWRVKEKKKIDSVGVDEKLEILAGIDSALAECEVKLGSRFFSLGDGTSEKYYVNSEGTRIASATPGVGFYAVFAVQDGKGGSMQRHVQKHETGGYERLFAWNLEETVCGEAKAIGRVLAEGVPAPEGEISVVCAPEVVGIACHESVGHPYEADRILGREGAQAGESFITQNDMGLRIGSDAATVVDDPTIPNSAGHYLYDDEGVKARRKPLMVNGVVSEFLLNRESAYLLGMTSNGSARAMDYESEPIVRMSNTFLLPGNYGDDELFEGVRKGVYVKSFTEWNIDDKRMNQKYVSCEAYLIENGRVGKPVKRAVIETTTPGFWGAVEAVGKKVECFAGTCGKGEPMQGVPVSMGGPPLRLKGIRLGV